MKVLKTSQLKLGERYWCIVSDRIVLITNDKTTGHLQKKGIVYNPITGLYDDILPLDYQLGVQSQLERLEDK